MSLETATYINGLVATNPVGSDPLSDADGHLRLLKSTIKTTFPNITGAVTVTQNQLNAVPNAVLKDGSVAMTGPLTLPADPSSSLQAATKQYVDAAAGGVLVDGSVTTAKLASSAVTPAKVSSGTYAISISGNAATATSATSASSASTATTATSLSTASGSAPSYSPRAWVNFNAVGTVTVYGSGNISSITDVGVGQFILNFSTALPSAAYAIAGTSGNDGVTTGERSMTRNGTFTTSACPIRVTNSDTTGSYNKDDVYNGVIVIG